MDEVAKYPTVTAEASAARASHSPVNFTIRNFIYCVLATIAIQGIALALFLPAVDIGPEPRFFTRLVEVQGLLDPCVPAAVRSPIFKLALDVDQVSERKRGPCAGGGPDATLRVSYRGIILAWGSVPRFCVDGRRSLRQRRRPSATVASVVATAEGFVLLEELRNMIRAEANAFGNVEFDVDGSLPGLGRLHCKTYWFQGEPTEALPPCSVHRTRGR